MSPQRAERRPRPPGSAGHGSGAGTGRPASSRAAGGGGTCWSAQLRPGATGAAAAAAGAATRQHEGHGCAHRSDPPHAPDDRPRSGARSPAGARPPSRDRNRREESDGAAIGTAPDSGLPPGSSLSGADDSVTPCRRSCDLLPTSVTVPVVARVGGSARPEQEAFFSADQTRTRAGSGAADQRAGGHGLCPGHGDQRAARPAAAPARPSAPATRRRRRPAGASSATAAPAAPNADASGLKVGLAYDIGGRGDGSFNDAAAAGLEKAIADLGRGQGEHQGARGGGQRERGRGRDPAPAAGLRGLQPDHRGRLQVRHRAEDGGHREPRRPSSPSSTTPRSSCPT